MIYPCVDEMLDLEQHIENNELCCWVFCQKVYEMMGETLPDINETTDLSIFDKVTRIKELEPFCLVAFCFSDRWHAGVVLLDNQHFIHMRKDKGVAVEKLDNMTWRHFFQGFYKWEK